MRPEEDSSYQGDEETGPADRPRWLASKAIFSICVHMIQWEKRLRSEANVDSSTADSFLQQLRTWNESIPPELRHFTSVRDTPVGPADRELFIGAIHVACSYYFTIILVTRPFLISHLVSHMRRSRLPHVEDKMPQPSTMVGELAQACLDSAIYMANTGYMAMNSAILTNNMCLLK